MGSGTKSLIISNEEMKDITKIVKSLEELLNYWLLIKGISETIKNEARGKKTDLLEFY